MSDLEFIRTVKERHRLKKQSERYTRIIRAIGRDQGTVDARKWNLPELWKKMRRQQLAFR